MARITFSPLIIAASGKVKDTVFSKWKGRNYIRARVTPANPQSSAQTLVRESLARCVALWQSLMAWYMTAWDEYASPYSLSGYNSFVGANRSLEQAGSLLIATPHNANVEKQATLTAVTGSGAGEIDVTWTGGLTGADIYCNLVVRKVGSNVFEQVSYNSVLNSFGSETITGLDAGEDYQVYSFVSDPTNNAYSASLGDTATAHA